MRSIREDEVTFTLETQEEDIPVRGAFASGDDDADIDLENEILGRLDNGDLWAWCYVKLTASIKLPDGTVVTGWDGLGGCSYRDEADFKQGGGYYESMKSQALDDLKCEIEVQIKRGVMLAVMFGDEQPAEVVS